MQSFSYSACAGVIALALTLGDTARADEDYPNAHLLVSPDAIVEASEHDGFLTGMGSDSLFRIVDVRPVEAFDDGHIPGAVNLPFTDLSDPHAPVAGSLKSDDKLLDLIGRVGIGKDTRVVIYDDRGGFRAARLFWLLEYFGHRKVAILNGGLPAWEDAGYETETIGPELKAMARVAGSHVQAVEFGASRQPRRIASADWVLSHHHDPEVSVIDVRPADMYEAGHIPWSVSIPWSGNLTSDGHMLSAATLRMHFEARGITSDRNIVIHCQTGEASAHSYFALRLLGYPRVRVYERSWAEWGMADDLPRS